jgi:hypothetical protein
MGEGFEVDGKPKKKADGEASTQMRMTSELLCAGVTLVHEIDLIGVSDIEIGVLLTALETFAMSPHIGGQSNRGHGKVSYTARVVIDMKTGNKSNMAFISGDDVIKISGEFCGAKEAYLGHLKAVSESGELDKFLVKKQDETAHCAGKPV